MMRPIATDVARSVVCVLCVCLSVLGRPVSSAKTDDRSRCRLGNRLVSNHVLDGDAYWCHLANMRDRSDLCGGGDVPCRYHCWEQEPPPLRSEVARAIRQTASRKATGPD